MARSITVIPVRANRESTAEAIQKKRVAAYCRVSTDSEDQISSFQAQVTYYTGFISNHPDYEIAGIFADEGISGTNTKKREQFNKMIEDCQAGKIDLIITKSISRFARNTLDALNYIRLLKSMNIGVVFEKENINSLDSKGEVLLTILSSLAQDESRSISENSTWGIRRRFEQGQVLINHTKFLGYTKDSDGNLVIDEKQAKIVRRIYTEFLNGKGVKRIAKELEDDGALNWNGKSNWHPSTITKILSNEKMKGDALLQKTFTIDFLSKKRSKNNGEVPQYYVEESHPPIIDKDTWEAVQLEFERRRAFIEKYNIGKLDYANTGNPFSGRVICGCCDSPFGRKVWNSTDERLRRIIWRCNKKYAVKGKKLCDNGHIDDDVLYRAFVSVYNVIIENKEYFMAKWQEILKHEDVLKRVTAKRLIGLFDRSNKIDSFDEELYLKVVEKLVVKDGEIVVTLLDGSEVECNFN